MDIRKGAAWCPLGLLLLLGFGCAGPDPQMYLTRADFLMQREKYDEVEALLTRALDKVDDPEYRRKYYLYRMNFYLNRYLATARTEHLRALSENINALRGENLIRDGLPFTYIAQVYEKRDKLELAIKYWTQAESEERNADKEKAGEYAFRILILRERQADVKSTAAWGKMLELYRAYLKKYPGHVRAKQVEQMEINATIRRNKLSEG